MGRIVRKLKMVKLCVDADGGLRLFGTVVEDPSGRFQVGHRIVTTKIIGISGTVVHSKNNDYQIIEPSLMTVLDRITYGRGARDAETLYVTKEE